VALHATQTIAEIAVSRVAKNQDEIAGKRTSEGDEEGVQEFRSSGVAGVQECRAAMVGLHGKRISHKKP
jgi:hypothetical protein